MTSSVAARVERRGHSPRGTATLGLPAHRCLPGIINNGHVSRLTVARVYPSCGEPKPLPKD